MSDVEDMYDSDSGYDYDSQLSDDDSPASSKAAFGSAETVVASSKPACAWTVIRKDELAAAQDAALDAVVSILGCPKGTARHLLIAFRWEQDALFACRLLIAFRWEQDALFADYAEKGSDHMYELARVATTPPPNPKRAKTSPVRTRAAASALTCQVCFGDAEPGDMTAMDCGHAFCNACWRHHFRVQIKEGNSRRLSCMADKCGAICNEGKVRALIEDDPQLLDTFSEKLLDSFVEDNRRVRWCPSTPHCGSAVKVDGEPWVEPTCSCGYEFCFQCSEDPHSPATCEMWKQWKEHGDKETINWIRVNTKVCPKCAKNTEKNGGCNHIHCSQCDAHWCWVCGGAFTAQTVYSHACNQFKEDSSSTATDAAKQLKRYLHYHACWQAHAGSVELEQQQMETLNKTIAELEAARTETSSLMDFSWLSGALAQLLAARKILGRSYVLAFYLFGGISIPGADFSECVSQQPLFEFAQQQLESEVERLSKLIESPVEDLLGAQRLAVINSTKSVDQRLRKLYELIENDVLSLLPTGQHISPYKALPNTIHP
ncbi:hypothetical protein WJX72_005259 [[Myrmecia] bisecta]|uniref:RBR-type E3 ubiquitin transferase n=1 Tax=[Myrmecia] bisecta TaxID=41462 RepID=A0AAW1PGR0_9CHLO